MLVSPINKIKNDVFKRYQYNNNMNEKKEEQPFQQKVDIES